TETALRLLAFFERLGELAQVFFLLLGLIEREGAVVLDRNAADEMEGVAVPVAEFIAALVDFLPAVADGAAMQAGARGKIVLLVARIVEIFLRPGFLGQPLPHAPVVGKEIVFAHGEGGV